MAGSPPAPTPFRLRRMIYALLWAPWLRPWLERVPLLRRIYCGWARIHPFDAAQGVDTSGFLAAADCAVGAVAAEQISPYGGSQPSIVRAALASLPLAAQYAFVDIGCGKGRPLVVASEFPYQRLLGVELAPQLVAVARTNAAVIAARHPERCAIEIELGDATAVSVPAERVVYFMYHAFDRELLGALLANLEQQLRNGLQHLFFVYYNPVHGELLDRSPHFSRWSARTHDYGADELGCGPDIADSVVIWQSRPERFPAQDGARQRIVVNASHWSHLATEAS